MRNNVIFSASVSLSQDIQLPFCLGITFQGCICLDANSGDVDEVSATQSMEVNKYALKKQPNTLKFD